MREKTDSREFTIQDNMNIEIIKRKNIGRI